MTPAEVAHIMSLVDKFAETCVRPVTLENVKVAEKARAAVEAALRDAPQAEGWKLVPASPTMEVRKHLEGKVGVDFLIAYADWCRPSAPTAVEPTGEDSSVVEPRDEQVIPLAAHIESGQGIVVRCVMGCHEDAERFKALIDAAARAQKGLT